MTAGADRETRKRMAWRASVTCYVVLTAFALAGGAIFKMFGITLPAFEIAGGLILLLIGIDMLQARRSTQEGASETEGEVTRRTSASHRSVFPCSPDPEQSRRSWC